MHAQVLHEVTAKSIYGRNAEGVKVAKAQVQRGTLVDGTPIIGMTMLPEDYRCASYRLPYLWFKGRMWL
jgi:hypothetical protein